MSPDFNRSMKNYLACIEFSYHIRPLKHTCYDRRTLGCFTLTLGCFTLTLGCFTLHECLIYCQSSDLISSCKYQKKCED